MQDAAVLALSNYTNEECPWFALELEEGHAQAYSYRTASTGADLLLVMVRSKDDDQLYWTDGDLLTFKTGAVDTRPVNAVGELIEGQHIDIKLPLPIAA